MKAHYENVDKYGHCVICHRNLLTERMVDGKIITMFVPDHDETEFLLNDGSRMRVCICKKCKSENELGDSKVQKTVMECVVNGWELETEALVADEKKPEWDKNRAESYMKVYANKKIEFHSEGLSTQVIEERKERLKKVIDGSDK